MNKEEIISNMPSFFKLNESLETLEKIELEIARKIDESINSDLIKHLLISEARQQIMKKLMAYIESNSELDHIILDTDMSIMKQLDIEKLIDRCESILSLSNFDNIISSSSIASNLSDSLRFEFEIQTQSLQQLVMKRLGSMSNNMGIAYKSGVLNLLGVKIPNWVDPYLRWNDTRIFFIECCEFNIDNIKIEEKDDHKLAPKVILSADFGLSVKKSKTLKVIVKDSEEHQEFIRECREKKIDDIIKYDF